MRNLTVQRIHWCRCEYCKPSLRRQLKNAGLALIAITGIWAAVKAYKENRRER